MSDQPVVQYTTKELLAEINRKVDAISTMLLAKADIGVVISMQLDQEKLEQRVSALEMSDAIYQAQSRDRKYLWGALLTLISVLVAVGGLIFTVTR